MFFINPFIYGGAGGDYESIATVTVGSGGASTIEFTSIPGTYQHLHIRITARIERSGSARDAIKLSLNGLTANDFAGHQLYGSGSGVSAEGGANVAYVTCYDFPASTAGTSIFGAGLVDILDYASTTKNTTVRAFAGNDRNGSGIVAINSGVWVNTNAVTSVTLNSLGGTGFAQHSTAALYGIKAP